MVDKINAGGGIRVGERKYQVNLIKSDTKSDFNVALAQANEMVFSDDIKYIISPILSGEALSAQSVTERNKVIMMSLCGTPKFSGPMVRSVRSCTWSYSPRSRTNNQSSSIPDALNSMK